MKHSTKFLQQRKLIMALPLLITPFITMIFWALGGGQVTPSQAIPAGLNLDLPSAHFLNKDESDKLSLYEEMQRDAEKFRDAQENDPYYDLNALSTSLVQQDLSTDDDDSRPDTTERPKRLKSIDPNEERVNRKLEELYTELSKNPQPETIARDIQPTPDNTQFSQDIDKLERMMERMQSPPAEDPEMQQIDQVLEKILDIQHPERVKEKIQRQTPLTEKNKVSSFTTRSDESWLGADQINYSQPSTQLNGFYDLDLSQEQQPNVPAIQAVIHGKQEVVSGAIVKMRLQTDLYLDGNQIPKDQFIYGIASLSGERLKISISSIQTDNQMIPVSMTVTDLDGLEGIYMPGAIARDAAREATDQAVQGVEFMSMSPSFSAQAASAGMQAAKGFLGKKSKHIKVTVKAGYQILLTPNNF